MQLRTLLLLGPSVASGLAIQARQANSTAQCCFQLASVNQTVLEDNVGELRLGGVFQEGGFCLNAANQTLQDSRGLNCFIRAPAFQFQCYQGAIGASKFTLASDGGGSTYLVVDGSKDFAACPVGLDGGAGSMASYNIFSPASPQNVQACKAVALSLKGATAGCSLPAGGGGGVGHQTDGSDVPPPAPTTTAVSATTSLPPATTVATRSGTATSAAADATQTAFPQGVGEACNGAAAPSAPSLTPVAVSVLDGGTGRRVPTWNASITGQNSTYFNFRVPADWPGSGKGANPVCALQFRLPAPADLPAGYPPYYFPEEQVRTNARAAAQFALTDDSAAAFGSAWADISPKRLLQGDRKVIGTFACHGPAGGNATDRDMEWLVSGVVPFALTFQQAGGNTGFADGVGAFVVAC